MAKKEKKEEVKNSFNDFKIKLKNFITFLQSKNEKREIIRIFETKMKAKNKLEDNFLNYQKIFEKIKEKIK